MNEQLEIINPITLDIAPPQKSRWGLAIFDHFSIQQRLPFFIFILLVTVIGAFSWISYLGVKNAGMAIGAERLTTLVDKLSVMFKGSVDQYVVTNSGITKEKSITEYLSTGNKDFRLQALDVFKKFEKNDTTCKYLQLLNIKKQEILGYSNSGLRLQGNIDSLIGPSVKVGKIILHNGSMYFPVIASVADGNKLIGYVVNWQLLRATQQSIDQFGQLLGSNGRLETTRELETAIIDIHDQKESEKRKDEFISIASHELKTPLTTIKAFFQLAVKEISPESKQYPMIGRVSRQVTRMERLIADLLDVSRINSGRMQYDLEDFDFDNLLKEVVASAQEISPDHTLILERSEPAIINGDWHRLEQVIINLLNNAVKYSPGENKVIIASEVREGNLLVTVRDFGIGIDKKHIDRLFERFSRADIGHRFQGLGLGLYISSEIIKRHGGSIHVESEPGKGSSFIFQLPLSQ